MKIIDIHTVLRSLFLIIKAAPRAFWAVFIGMALFGSGPAILLWLSKLLIDEASQYSFDSVTFWNWLTRVSPLMILSMASFLVLNLILDGLETMTSFQLSILRDRLKIVAQESLLEKTVNVPTIEIFETPHLLNLFTLAEASIHKLQYLAIVLSNLTGGLFVVIPTVLLSATIAWWIPVIIFLVSAPSIYYQFYYEGKTWSIESAQAALVRRMNIHAEVLTRPMYAKEIRMYGLGNYFLHSWRGLITSAFEEMQAVRRTGAIATLFWSTVSGIGTGIPFIYVVFQTTRGELTLGDLALFTGLVFQVRRGLNMLIGTLTNIQSIVLGTKPLFEYLDHLENAAPQSAEGQISALKAAGLPNPELADPPAISLVDVSFKYPGIEDYTIRGINLEIKSGEMVVIVGENGAGKTTLAKLICRLYEPSSGQIMINGIDYRAIPILLFRQAIAAVFQDFARFPATLRENIGFGDLSRMDQDEELFLAAEQSGVIEMVSSLPDGYDTLLSKLFEDGVDLSGGQWQRVAIARALMRTKAPIVLLDEPTASLDPHTEFEALNTFRTLAQSSTTVIISHRLALARIAHKVVVVAQGKIVEQGSHESLLRSEGRYAMMFRQQASNYVDIDNIAH